MAQTQDDGGQGRHGDDNDLFEAHTPTTSHNHAEDYVLRPASSRTSTSWLWRTLCSAINSRQRFSCRGTTFKMTYYVNVTCLLKPKAYLELVAAMQAAINKTKPSSVEGRHMLR